MRAHALLRLALLLCLAGAHTLDLRISRDLYDADTLAWAKEQDIGRYTSRRERMSVHMATLNEKAMLTGLSSLSVALSVVPTVAWLLCRLMRCLLHCLLLHGSYHGC